MLRQFSQLAQSVPELSRRTVSISTSFNALFGRRTTEVVRFTRASHHRLNKSNGIAKATEAAADAMIVAGGMSEDPAMAIMIVAPSEQITGRWMR